MDSAHNKKEHITLRDADVKCKKKNYNTKKQLKIHLKCDCTKTGEKLKETKKKLEEKLIVNSTDTDAHSNITSVVIRA